MTTGKFKESELGVAISVQGRLAFLAGVWGPVFGILYIIHTYLPTYVRQGPPKPAPKPSAQQP